jgi:hypothetical protein
MPSNSAPTFSNVSEDKQDDPRGRIDPIELETGKQATEMEELGKEFGVLRVEPTQTLYHGGQHWVSTMFQVRIENDTC